jgi:hypothetical protein
MASLNFKDPEFIFIASIVYVFLAISVARLGSYRACGGLKALLVSFLFTPVLGMIYVLSFTGKNVLKITHYRCPSCNLEYTSKYKYCPSCAKDGRKVHLERISMKTY